MDVVVAVSISAILCGYDILHTRNSLVMVGGENRTKPKASSEIPYPA